MSDNKKEAAGKIIVSEVGGLEYMRTKSYDINRVDVRECIYIETVKSSLVSLLTVPIKRKN